MEQQELSRVPVTVEATWNQEKRRSFVNDRLASLALMEHADLDFESELPMAA